MPDVPLNQDGRAQAAALAGHFAGRGITAVIASPMQRARETAAPIAAALGLKLLVEPRFDELDVGAWTGATFQDLHTDREWQAFNRFRSFAPVPGGETMLAVQARAVAAIGALRETHPDGEVVVVSHSDVVKSLLAYFLGVPLDLFRRLEITPASRSKLILYDDDARIDGINHPLQ
jgi:probable phosphoglycerate mutase